MSARYINIFVVYSVFLRYFLGLFLLPCPYSVQLSAAALHRHEPTYDTKVLSHPVHLFRFLRFLTVSYCSGISNQTFPSSLDISNRVLRPCSGISNCAFRLYSGIFNRLPPCPCPGISCRRGPRWRRCPVTAAEADTRSNLRKNRRRTDDTPQITDTENTRLTTGGSSLYGEDTTASSCSSLAVGYLPSYTLQ